MSKRTRPANQGSEIAGRVYQHGFYDSCDRVRDQASRLEIARKIYFVLDHVLEDATDGMHCLDIGCSSGVVTNAVAHRFASITGLDIDRRAFWDRDRLEGENAKFIEGDAMQLPFPSSAFDFILCLQVYEHVPSDENLIAEIFRVLKPGGIVFFSGPNLLFPIEPHYHLLFLHWLPQAWADSYLRVLRKGQSYYEKLRSYWGLRRIVREFTFQDISLDIMFYKLHQNRTFAYSGTRIEQIIACMFKAMLPWIPNFNWILRKVPPNTGDADQ